MLAQFWDARNDKAPGWVSILAPNHGMGRVYTCMQLRKGGIAYSTLKSDMSHYSTISVFATNTLVYLPRVFELIYQYHRMK